MVTQFVPAPIAWDVEFIVSGQRFTYPVVGWVYDGQSAHAYVVDDNGAITSQAALFERLGAVSCALVRVDESL